MAQDRQEDEMCVEVSFANRSSDGTIQSIGGYNGGWGGSSSQWKLSVSQVISLIDTGTWSFFVRLPTSTPPDRVSVRIVPAGVNRSYLRTEADGDVPNNLLALPQQSAGLPYSEPQFPADLPGARKPQLEGIYSSAHKTPLAEPEPGFAPFYTVLPSKTVNVQLSAPFAQRFEVMVNGEWPLPEVSSTTFVVPSPQDEQGWFALRSMGYVGKYTGQPLKLDRDSTLYELAIRLPESVRYDLYVNLLIAQTSLNPKCVPPDDKSSYLHLPLLKGPAFTSAPPASSAPASGVDTVNVGIQDKNDLFSFTTMLTNPKLDGARITTIKNISRDVNHDQVVDLEVQHKDTKGQSIGPVSLSRGAATGAFRDLLVNGDWSVRATNISAKLLDSREINLEVAWNKP
jgi:hypothetical protein